MHYFGQTYAVARRASSPSPRRPGGRRSFGDRELVAHVVDKQAVGIQAPKSAAGRFPVKPSGHNIPEKIGDADPRCARAENHHALIPQRRSADTHRGNRGRECDGARALQIVAEGTKPAAASIEDAARIARREIFQLKQGVWK